MEFFFFNISQIIVTLISLNRFIFNDFPSKDLNIFKIYIEKKNTF